MERSHSRQTKGIAKGKIEKAIEEKAHSTKISFFTLNEINIDLFLNKSLLRVKNTKKTKKERYLKGCVLGHTMVWIGQWVRIWIGKKEAFDNFEIGRGFPEQCHQDGAAQN